jgi:hypothetical protein
MKIEKPRCPECDLLVSGTSENVPGLAHLVQQDDGSFEYQGGTKLFWDGVMTERTEEGEYMLLCENGHDWPSKIEF